MLIQLSKPFLTALRAQSDGSDGETRSLPPRAEVQRDWMINTTVCSNIRWIPQDWRK